MPPSTGPLGRLPSMTACTQGGLGMYLCFDMTFETVKNGLPSIALRFDRICFFGIKRYAHLHIIRELHKFDLSDAVAKRILNVLVRFDLRVGSSKFKSHTSV